MLEDVYFRSASQAVIKPAATLGIASKPGGPLFKRSARRALEAGRLPAFTKPAYLMAVQSNKRSLNALPDQRNVLSFLRIAAGEGLAGVDTGNIAGGGRLDQPHFFLRHRTGLDVDHGQDEG